MNTDRIITILFVAVVAVILIGEVFVYSINNDRYSSNVNVIGDGVEYSVTSRGSDQYTVLILNNGTFGMNEHYYIYYDPDHMTNVEEAQVPVGAKAFTTEYYVSQIIKMLEYRGISTEVLNAAELYEAINGDLESVDISKGLVVLSGVLPDTIYNGTDNGLIFDWLNSGGSLYWAGGLLGAYYSTLNGMVPAGNDYQTWFFGSECLNTGNTDKAFSDITSNNYRYTLSLTNNSVKYSVDTNKLPNDREYLAVGYTEGGYSSIVMTSFGKGMICVFGGDYSNTQRQDLAQIVSSGICCYTSAEPAGISEGNVKRGTVTGVIEIELAPNIRYVAYVYFGGYYPVYGNTQGLIV